MILWLVSYFKYLNHLEHNTVLLFAGGCIHNVQQGSVQEQMSVGYQGLVGGGGGGMSLYIDVCSITVHV